MKTWTYFWIAATVALYATCAINIICYYLGYQGPNMLNSFCLITIILFSLMRLFSDIKVFGEDND